MTTDNTADDTMVEDEDGSVIVPLVIEDGLLFQLMKEAHALDITFNEYINMVFLTYLEQTCSPDDLDTMQPLPAE